MTGNSSVEVMQVRRQRSNFFTVLKKEKKNNWPSRILGASEIHFKNKGEIEMSSDLQKLKENLSPTDMHYKRA